MVVRGTLVANLCGAALVGAVSANRAMLVGQPEGALTALCPTGILPAEQALLPATVETHKEKKQ